MLLAPTRSAPSSSSAADPAVCYHAGMPIVGGSLAVGIAFTLAVGGCGSMKPGAGFQ